MPDAAKAYFKEGEYGIALFAACLGISVTMVGAIMLLILAKGFAHFMPQDLFLYEVHPAGSVSAKIAGEVHAEERITAQALIESGYTPRDKEKQIFSRSLIKVGNREFGRDFVWVLRDSIVSQEQHPDLMLIERHSYGNFYGFPLAIRDRQGTTLASYGDSNWEQALNERLRASKDTEHKLEDLRESEIDQINYELEKLRLAERRLEFDRQASQKNLEPIAEERAALQARYEVAAREYEALTAQLDGHSLLMRAASGQERAVSFGQIVRLYQTNQQGFFGRSWIYLQRLTEFVSGDPRESNTEGGVFPAILGTVMMVLLMSILVMPLGVVAALYLYVYAKQNFLTQAVRVAVNNLAGVPSVVFGMFGLGFFVYSVGGTIDSLFYPEALPNPTFGSGGILWASLTLALLTLPVVIVATEEGLTRIPRHLPEGSMALGATRFETLWRISLPIVSPSIMTGMILAIARATGEVAPLMLVGVVKLAPSMPIDANFPFFHLDRKFMHLGFHIYDVGFQSPNVEAARPLIYATAALLLIAVLLLNALAIVIRNRLRENYKNLS